VWHHFFEICDVWYGGTPHTHTTLHTQFSLEKTHDGTATGASRFILRIPSVAHITSGAFKEPHKAIV
jgi:hypothetical protein